MTMAYEEFKENVIIDVQNIMSTDQATAKVKEIGRVLGHKDCIKVAIKSSADCTASAVFDVAPLYTIYEKHGSYAGVFQILKERLIPMKNSADFLNYSGVKDKLQVVARSVDWCKSQPNIHIISRMEDIAIVACVKLYENENGTDAIYVTNDLIKHWGVEEKQFNIDAMENTILDNMAEIVPIEDMIFITPADEKLMYVLTNEEKVNGAAVIAYPGYLKTVGNKLNDDFYIIPSSIHEVMAIRASYIDEMDPEQYILKKLISEVNKAIVDDGDVLTDTLYRYDRDLDKFETAENYSQRTS